MRAHGVFVAASVAALAVQLVGAAGPALAQADPSAPRIIDLGTLPGGSSSDLFGTDNRGMWVGASDDARGRSHAVWWRDGRIHDLGVPTAPANGIEVWASDVNRHDVVVANGPASARQPDVSRAYIWQAGRLRQLPLPAGAGSGWVSFVRRINDSGTAVGSITAPGNPAVERPVIWPHAGTPRFVQLPAGFDGGAVLGINDRGDLVGEVYNANVGLAVGWDRRGNLYPLAGTDLNGYSEANVVDADGTAAGLSDFGHTLPGAEAVTWRGNQERGLGFFPQAQYSWILATNGHGAYSGVASVGTWPDAPEYVMIVRASRHPRMLTLLPLSRHFGDATGAAHVMSADLTVGGTSQTATGQFHATLWTHAFEQGFVPPVSNARIAGRGAQMQKAPPVSAPEEPSVTSSGGRI